MQRAGLLIPREHGAWGMLLVPFVAGMFLARSWTWLLLVALIAVLTVFIAREPLIILTRQRWVWRDAHAETADARANLKWEITALAVCGALLLAYLPAGPLLALGAMSLLLTVTAIRMTIRNRQRSILLQISSAFGLGSTALLVSLAANGEVMPWAWWLWLFTSLHSFSSVLAVHARLDSIAGGRNAKLLPQAGRMRRAALFAQLGLLCVAAATAGWFERVYALPILLSACLNTIELIRLRYPATLKEPLRHVGFRALGFSIAHTSLAVALLW